MSLEAKLDELTGKHPGSYDSGELFFPDENLLNHVNQVNDVHTLDSLPDACQTALKSFQQRASNSFQLKYVVIGFPPPFFVV